MTDESLPKIRISQLPKSLVINDSDILPISQLGKRLELGAFTTTGASVSDIRTQMYFKNAASSIDNGMSITISGQIFHVLNENNTKVTEYLNSNGIPSPTGNVFFTQNAIQQCCENITYPIKQPSVVDDAYSGTVSADVRLSDDGRKFSMRVPTPNTGSSPTLSINGGPARSIRAYNGSNVYPGDITGNVEFEWFQAPAQFRLIDSTLRDRTFYLSGGSFLGTVTSDGSSPNLVEMTIPGMLGANTLIFFSARTDNTGPMQLAVTPVITGARYIRDCLKGPNTPLAAGDIQANQMAAFKYIPAPIDKFMLISSGDVRSLFRGIDSRVKVVEENIGDVLTAIKPTMIDNPFGLITFLPGGIKHVEKRQLIITGTGSSIGKAAGSSNPAVFSPNAQLVEQLNKQLLNTGGIEVINDNQSIPTQAIQQFSAQLDNSPYSRSDIVTIIAGMNDGPVGNFNSGATYTGNQGRLIALINKCKARGAIPVLCTTPHNDVRKIKYSLPTNVASSYPIRMFNMSGTFAFDSEEKTITHGYFSNAGYGGNILKPGDKLQVANGVNAGIYTIARISENRVVISTVEDIPVTNSSTVTITHVQADQELVLEPPPSKSIVTRDWGRNGILFPGDFRFGLLNNMMRSVQRQTGCFLLDFEVPFMKVVSTEGWDSVYAPQNFNHFNDYGYTVIGKVIRDFGDYLCDQVFTTKYFE